MCTRKLVLAIGLVGALGLVSVARAQWVRLQRCEGALPCAIPFGVRYAPDSLIAGQFGRMSPNGFSGRISFDPKLTVEIDKPHVSLESPDFAAEAARRFVLAHPNAPRTEPAPKGPAPTPTPAPPRN
ncbi:MAG TPA: hypothetical protein VGS98_03230 [Thermoanaerobaculia bacterium]|jgi:hypothetical protein|nr:hypothetical protein [Thermoanaerobaculia bacterium]